MPTATRSIVFLLYDGFQSIDFAGPLQVFATANDELGKDAYYMKSVSPFAATVRMHPGVQVVADSVGDIAGSINTLIIPGGPGIDLLLGHETLASLINKLATKSERICSICTGAFLMADAGWLDGREVTTHWRSCDRLAAMFPKVIVNRDPIWIRSGHIWSSAGVTAGIDLALALVEADFGGVIAQRVARRLVVYMRRSGGQTQFSAALALQMSESFSPLIGWITGNLEKSLTVDILAQQMSMTPRTFYRKFVARTGVSPAKAVERLRLDAARNLMETTKVSLEAVAVKVGFGSGYRFRRAFARTFGVSPGEWRSHFGLNDRVESAASPESDKQAR